MQGSASSLGERTMCSFAIRRAAKGLAFICFHFDGRLTRGSRVLFQNLAFDHKKTQMQCRLRRVAVFCITLLDVQMRGLLVLLAMVHLACKSYRIRHDRQSASCFEQQTGREFDHCSFAWLTSHGRLNHFTQALTFFCPSF